MKGIDRRLEKLERAAQPEGQIVVVWDDEDDGQPDDGRIRLRWADAPEEAALRLEEARRQAGPNGTVLRVTYGDRDAGADG